MNRPLTRHIQADRIPLTIANYENLDGYRSLLSVIGKLEPSAVIQKVKDSGLLGRGGAGFPTGLKWSFVPSGPETPNPKYLVANADEMEPGTFKDRLLLESNPHLLIEGMILAAYAIGADCAYIFLRGEYTRSESSLRTAIEEAYRRGYLGEKILNASFNLDLHLHMSGGRYICGEETGLLNALEGKRAIPRAKPPFPQVSGLWGKPTIVQNVETLCNLPYIMLHTSDEFRELSLTGEGGTKLYGVSGKVRKTGLWEMPLGTTAREIIEKHAGGMQDGYRLRAFLPGGASTDFLTVDHLDLPLDYKHVQSAGSRLGTGTMILLDDRSCPVGMNLNLIRFFMRESCGWCTPCREGLPWVENLLQAIESGDGRPEDLELLDMHCRALAPGNTFCALAPGAVEPLQSALKYFRQEFLDHISQKACSFKSQSNAPGT